MINSAVPEIIDLDFAKTSLKLAFSMTKYERFGLVFTKARIYKFGHRCFCELLLPILNTLYCRHLNLFSFLFKRSVSRDILGFF